VGAGQPAIRVTHDLVAAGYNMMNGLPVTANSTVGESSCNGGACSKFGSAEEAAAMTVKVLGDRSMRTCANASECTSGDADDQPGTTVAGTGFAPLLEEATKANAEQLVRLVNGTEKPTAANLAKLKTGGLPVTAGVIKALQRDPDNAALTARLAGELAMSDTVETALLMRRMMVTGMSEPNAAAQPKAIDTAGQRIEALDREIAALKNEMEMKRELSRNSVLTIIDRENQRVETNPQTQSMTIPTVASTRWQRRSRLNEGIRMRNKTTVRKVLTRAGIFLACMALFMVVSLMMADTAMKHPTEAAAFRSWMQSTRYGWLMWRLALYALVAWGLWKIRHAPGFREAYRRPLLRISVVSVLFIALCEYAMFTGPGA
jgi:hypothetical protein